jgi:hypothetical protein
MPSENWTLQSVLSDASDFVPKKVPYGLSLAILADVFRDAGARVDDIYLSRFGEFLSPDELALVSWLAQAHVSFRPGKRWSPLGEAVIESLSSMPSSRRPKLGRRTIERWIELMPVATLSRLVDDGNRREEAIRKWFAVLEIKVPGETKAVSLRRLSMIDSTAAQVALAQEQGKSGGSKNVLGSSGGVGLMAGVVGLVYGYSVVGGVR